MSTLGSRLLDGIGECIEAAAVTIVAPYAAPVVGTIDDNAEQVTKPRRTHVVPVSDAFDVERGGGRCQRVLTFDVVVHYMRAPADMAKMVDDAEAFENVLRSLPSLLAALSPTIGAHQPQVISGAQFGYSDVATATWRVSIRYRRS